MAFIKKNFYGLLAAGLGTLQFLLFAMPFLSYNGWGRYNFNAYDLMGGDSGTGVFLIITLIVGILLMLVGAYALVRSLAVPAMPDGFGPVTVEKACTFGLWGYGGVAFTTLIVAMIDLGDAMGTIAIGIGAWLLVLLALHAAATPIVLPRIGFFNEKAPAPEAAPAAYEAMPTAPYAPVVPEAYPAAPVAPVAPATAVPPKFCPNCGAAQGTPSTFCTNCGARLM